MNEYEKKVVNKALKIMEEHHKPGEKLSSPSAAKNWLRLRLKDKKHEIFGCIFLDARKRIQHIEDIFTGTVHSTKIHARTIVEKAIEHNSDSIILYHNHPSGNAKPSQGDIILTRKLEEILKHMDITIVDHLVVSHSDSKSIYSMAKMGLL